LGLERRPARVGLRPHRDVDLETSYDDAFERCRAAIEFVLGASILREDRAGGLIEAGFGLVNSERVRCSLTSVDAARTGVRIEALFAAGVDVPESSRNVDALAAALAQP